MHEVLTVVVRILGLLLIFVTLRDAPGWVGRLWPVSPDESFVFVYIHAAIRVCFLLVAVLMIKFPAAPARMLMAKTDMDSPVLEENGEAIQIAGITIVGVCVLTWSIPRLVYDTLWLWHLRRIDQFFLQSYAGFVIDLIAAVIGMLIGLWCALGAKGMVGVVRKLRS